MADQRPIIFGPGDKLLWLERIAVHPDATDIDARVGIAIANRIDKATGLAVVSARWIADWIGRKAGKKPPQGNLVPGERSVQDSISRMRRIGLVEVATGGGRHKANTYRPLIEGAPKHHGQPWGNGAANVTASREVFGETSRLAAQNLTASRTKPHGQPCTLPNSLPKSLPNADDGDDARAREETRAQLREEWNAIWADLLRLVGPTLTSAWFDRCSLAGLRGDVVTIYVADAFKRSRIERDYLEQLEAACRREYPSMRRLRLLDEAARAAE